MGNKKGVFTRQRQPKTVAHMIRKRWTGKDLFS
jgi:beta-glucuronidase